LALPPLLLLLHQSLHSTEASMLQWFIESAAYITCEWLVNGTAANPYITTISCFHFFRLLADAGHRDRS
jgi:hypothetical protein